MTGVWIEPIQCTATVTAWSVSVDLISAIRALAREQYQALELESFGQTFMPTLAETDRELTASAQVLAAAVQEALTADGFNGEFSDLGNIAAVALGLQQSLRDQTGASFDDTPVGLRIARLRSLGLLDTDTPGDLYLQWIRNTVDNGVDLDVLVDVIDNHDITPSSFDVLAGLEEVRDDEGKSFYLLNGFTTPEAAAASAVMTYVLNAGTGYPGGDHPITPWSSDEITRIIERRVANDWSYEGVTVVHLSGGRLATTPNGMLMGVPGAVQLSANGGTTYGDIFMVTEIDGSPTEALTEIIQSGGSAIQAGQTDLDRLLRHEEEHSRQWAALGPVVFPVAYADEATEVVVHVGVHDGWGPFDYPYIYPTIEEGSPCDNAFEEGAGFADGGYSQCS